MRLAGADYVFAPYEYDRQPHGAGDAEATRFLNFIDFTTRISAWMSASNKCGCQLRANSPPRHFSKCNPQGLGVIVPGHSQNGWRMLSNPPAEAEIEGGDFLIAMGESANLRRLEQMLTEVQK